MTEVSASILRDVTPGTFGSLGGAHVRGGAVEELLAPAAVLLRCDPVYVSGPSAAVVGADAFEHDSELLVSRDGVGTPVARSGLGSVGAGDETTAADGGGKHHASRVAVGRGAHKCLKDVFL